MSEKPLIAHVIYRLDTGGMERIAVSVINATRDRYRHAVICLAGFGNLRKEIEDASVPCLTLDKRPGKDWGCYFRLWKALRRLKPGLVQTYNVGTMDMAPIARLAGVHRVVHAEHGRDAADPDGTNRRYRTMRRWLQPFIACHVAVSRDLESWLADGVGIRRSRIAYIANGIDVTKFEAARRRPEPRGLLRDFAPEDAVVVASVARLDRVKDQAGLITAFKHLRERAGASGVDVRLVIAGDAAELGLDGLIALSILILASGELINVMEQLRLPDSSKYGLSVLWGAYALAVIAVGIKLAKKHLRIFGIVLLGITLAKLFIYDIADLPTIPKTILFVSLGILMLIVSFLYTKYRHVIFGVAD